MKKHKQGIREQWMRKRGVIIRVLEILAVLLIFSVGIFGAYVCFTPKGQTQTTGSNNSGILVTRASENIVVSTESVSDTVSSSASSAPITTSPVDSKSSDPKPSSAETTAASSAAVSSTAAKNPPGSAPDLTGYVVVLDPGHQLHANSEQESLGPDMSGTKDKCSSGTSGVSTGRPEYKVNLEIGLKMRDYLESLGCTVYMTRTTNDVDISNIDRANIALSHSPDVYIRLHCDGSTNSSSRGVGVFVADTGKYSDSLSKWGDILGGALSDATGAKYRGCNASSVYSGLNWAASIPSFLLEMGFMSNATDDKLLSDPDYQQKICEGVADFVSQMPHISG